VARAVVLDTSVFIYWLEGNSEFGPYALDVMRKIEDGQIQGFASELVLGELLIRPMKLGLSEIVESYIKDLPEFPNLEFRAVDREVIIEAARLRAEYSIGFADALHVANASLLDTVLITNDQGLIKPNLATVLLQDFATEK